MTISTMLLATCLAVQSAASGTQDAPPATKPKSKISAKIVYKGPFIKDTTIPGLQKKDGVVPQIAGCWRLSKDRWMWTIGMVGFSGPDDGRACIYQIRATAPDGPILKEGILYKRVTDWDPYHRGDSFWKHRGHVVVFGVPKGAVKDGKPLPNNNVFVARWFNLGRILKDGRLVYEADGVRPPPICVEWTQFRLNDAGDDIEILSPIRRLRQKGYEQGEAFTSLSKSHVGMNAFVAPPTPFNDTCTEWVECAYFYPAMAAVLYKFNPRTGLYEWTRTGPPARGREPSLTRIGDEWIVATRKQKPGLGQWKDRLECTAWFRTKDLFDPVAGLGKPTETTVPAGGPRVAYLCPDGVLRIFTGDESVSSYHERRNPLYCWDVNPKDFSASNRQVVMDGPERELRFSNVPSRFGKGMNIGFARLSPLLGNRQILTYRLMTRNFKPATEAELDQCGTYYSEVIYDGDVKEQWEFAE